MIKRVTTISQIPAFHILDIEHRNDGKDIWPPIFRETHNGEMDSSDLREMCQQCRHELGYVQPAIEILDYENNQYTIE